MIAGLGTDIIEISRMVKALENPRFIERVFTQRNRLIAAVAARPQRLPMLHAGRGRKPFSRLLAPAFVRESFRT
jgi:phosphopantetheinyl transferase (holo-ACP synthase)